jgi:hypothetical protein
MNSFAGWSVILALLNSFAGWSVILALLNTFVGWSRTIKNSLKINLYPSRHCLLCYLVLCPLSHFGAESVEQTNDETQLSAHQAGRFPFRL